ncbi:MAG: caspase family protein [Geminicoccaceae bacterium]
MRQGFWSITSPRRGLYGLAMVTMCALATTADANAEGRVALVVGNGAYSGLPALPNPTQDANLLADQLRALNFEVIEVLDSDLGGMVDAVRDFGQKAKDAEAVLFYYAGHGVQNAGENYLMPVDAEVEEVGDLRYESMALTLVMEELEHASADISLVILDACRDNPLVDQQSTRTIGTDKGLATVRGATGMLIAYATAPGNVAYDGVGEHSPFSSSLAEWINEPGLEIGLMFRRVRQDVVDATDGLQVPWIEEAIIGDFYFVPGERVVAPVVADAPRRFDIADSDTVFWRTIEEMTTEQQRRAGLNLYLQVFPAGQFSDEANQQLAALDAGNAVAPDKLMAEVAPPGAGAFTDIILWESIKQTQTEAELEDYLRAHPKGLFAGEASERLKEIKRGPVAGEEFQVASLLQIPYGVSQFPMGFRQTVADRAISPDLLARVRTVPEAGQVVINGRDIALGDQLRSADLVNANYYPPNGITGPLGNFGVVVPESNGSETVLAARIDVGLDEPPIREVAATAGIGPVPITLTLPPDLGAGPTTVTVEALPHKVRLMTPTAELTPGIQFNVESYVDVALAVPEGAQGDLGEIVYSFEQPTRGIVVDGEANTVRESIQISGLEPDYDVQAEFDAYLGVGFQALPVILPQDDASKVLIEELPFGGLKLSDGSPVSVGDYLEASKLEGVGFEAHRHIVGPVGQFAYSYKDGSERLVQAIGVTSSVHDCDHLASDPFDENRVTDGRWLWNVRGDGRKVESFIDSAAALLACLSAADQFPNVDRFRLQVGRAYAGRYEFEATLPWIEPLVEKGDPRALAGMAKLYHEGAGVPQSYEKAFEFYSRSAELGYMGAIHSLGKAYRDGLGVRRDYEQGAYWIEKAADWGFVWAQLNMAKIYLRGLGVRQDDGTAVAWFQKAIEQNNGWGMIMLGNLYLEGRGVPQSIDKAIELFQLASDAGRLEFGDIELAKLYLKGQYVEKNPEKAVEYLKSALAKYEGGNAKVELAKLMMNGTGLPTDPAGGLALLEEVASGDEEKAAAYAMTTMARAFEAGDVLPADSVRAVELYQQAAELGHLPARERVARFYRSGNGLPRDSAKARELFERAAMDGHVWSALHLADMQMRGEGGPADLESALAWLGRVHRQAGNDKLRQQVIERLQQIPEEQQVKTIQTWLKEEGYDPGPADGLMGAATRQAIVAFESSRGLVPQGEPSLVLLAELSPK